jgi:hypothetical protein
VIKHIAFSMVWILFQSKSKLNITNVVTDRTKPRDLVSPHAVPPRDNLNSNACYNKDRRHDDW